MSRVGVHLAQSVHEQAITAAEQEGISGSLPGTSLCEAARPEDTHLRYGEPGSQEPGRAAAHRRTGGDRGRQMRNGRQR